MDMYTDKGDSRQAAFFFVILVSLFVILFFAFRGKKEDAPEDWRIYRGSMNGYYVGIEEEKKGEVWTRLVVLEWDGDPPDSRPFGMRGFDRDGDGRFDQISISPASDQEYVTLHYISGGRCKWETDQAELPTEQEIAYASAKLYMAVAKIHTPEYMVEREDEKSDKDD